MANAPMSKAEFRQALKAMATTPHKIAEDIGVSRRQAYRYACGETDIPPAMAILVRMLVKRHKAK